MIRLSLDFVDLLEITRFFEIAKFGVERERRRWVRFRFLRFQNHEHFVSVSFSH